MTRIITLDDIIDIYHKAKQRGPDFILSKLNIKKISRTKSAFNETAVESSNWWIIPKVKERWNSLITGNPTLNYEEYLANNLFKNKTNLKLLSLGSGSCGHELELAKHSNFSEIVCVDISENRLLEAEIDAKKNNLNNIKFICADVNSYALENNYFDIVFFHSSLHHFDNVKNLLETKVKNCLNKEGVLIINEYVGPSRLQFPKHQIKEINKGLKILPNELKVRFKSKNIKNKFYGSGVIRMIIADPSECIDSANIMPTIHSNFSTIIEKPYGGNILMNVLKDISHNFINLSDKNEKLLNKLFLFEDEYLKNNASDFVFGVYKKK